MRVDAGQEYQTCVRVHFAVPPPGLAHFLSMTSSWLALTFCAFALFVTIRSLPADLQTFQTAFHAPAMPTVMRSKPHKAKLGPVNGVHVIARPGSSATDHSLAGHQPSHTEHVNLLKSLNPTPNAGTHVWRLQDRSGVNQPLLSCHA